MPNLLFLCGGRRVGLLRRFREAMVECGGRIVVTDTDLTTFGYQHALAGTPWRYYRLVMTQWPRVEGEQTTPIPASRDGSIANTFPGEGAFSACGVTIRPTSIPIRP